MKKILASLVTALMALSLVASPAGAATPPDYMSALSCLYGGLTNGPDSDPDLVESLELVFEAAALEAAGDYEEAMKRLKDAEKVLKKAKDTTPLDCRGAVAETGRDLAVYTVDLWAEAGGDDDDIEHAGEHIEKGDKHQAKGEPDKALKEYEKALKHAVKGL